MTNNDFKLRRTEEVHSESILRPSHRYRILFRLAISFLCVSQGAASKTRGPIATKFYLKHHWGGGKPALGFGPGRIRTLVSIATDSSHRVTMGKTASPRFLGCF